MRRMFASMVAIALLAHPAIADAQRERACQLQGDLVGAVQQARLNRVPKSKLTETIAASNPHLSESVLATIPALGNHVYSIKRRDLKKVDLRSATKQQCIDNWEQIQKMQKDISN